MISAAKPISEELRHAIELCAYHIWEREGRPQGREREHWLMAEAEILGTRPAKKATPAKSNGSTKAAKTKAANGAAKAANGAAKKASAPKATAPAAAIAAAAKSPVQKAKKAAAKPKAAKPE